PGSSAGSLSRCVARRSRRCALRNRTAPSSRRYFQDAYAEAFEAADEVLIAPVGRAELPSEERLDVVALAAAISARGRPARAFDSLDAIVETLVASARPGDSLVFMSNGGFGGIHATTEAALRG
ncbi:MAG: hypothetical protein AAFU79_24420, partial [Myxococcota bacterium]